MKRDPKVSRLAELRLLDGVSIRDVARLAPLFDEIDLAEGTVLMRQGRCAGETFVVASGTASVQVDGREIAVLAAGDVVGELAVLARGRRTATVVATTDMRMFVVHPVAFEALLREPLLGARIAACVARRTSALIR
jgi:CRP-like cAMP-binding protein